MVTTQATRLAQAHRAAQAQLAEALARVISAHWRINVRAPGVGTEEFLAAAARAVQQQSRTSASLARSYYSTARTLELPGVRSLTIETPDLPEEKVIAGLVASGFQQLSDSLEAGRDLKEALDIAGRSAVGSAVRNTLEPGRRGIMDAQGYDDRVVGLMWVTAGDARVCHWCSMLESRGAVFKDGSWKTQGDPRPDGTSKVSAHDICRCSLAPFFSSTPDLPDSVQARYDQWRLATGHATGDEKRLAWRRYWEAMGRGEDEVLALARARRDLEQVARLSGSIGTETEEAA